LVILVYLGGGWMIKINYLDQREWFAKREADTKLPMVGNSKAVTLGLLKSRQICVPLEFRWVNFLSIE
jgi:hypothetical protein